MADELPKNDDRDDAPKPHRTLDARELFRGEREIWIEHAGVRYVLRITRRDRLILTK
jgi:hemin uptake protein HemP